MTKDQKQKRNQLFNTNGIPERSFVLQVLGASKKQDDALQARYANHKGSNIKKHVKPTAL